LGIGKHLHKYWFPKFRKTNALMKLKKETEGAAPGSRAWPVKGWREDKELGIRADWGELIINPADGKRKRIVNFQPNKNAKNEALNAAAEKNSHSVIHKSMFPIEKSDQEALTDDDFLEGLDKGMTKPK